MTHWQTERVPAAAVAPFLVEWRRRGGRFSSLDPSRARACRRIVSGESETIGVYTLDAVCTALERPDLFVLLTAR